MVRAIEKVSYLLKFGFFNEARKMPSHMLKQWGGKKVLLFHNFFESFGIFDVLVGSFTVLAVADILVVVGQQ